MASGINSNYGYSNNYTNSSDYASNQTTQTTGNESDSSKTSTKTNQSSAAAQSATKSSTTSNSSTSKSSTTSTQTANQSKLPSPFEEKLAALKQIDTDGNGLTIGDLAKAKFDYEATSAKGNLEDLAFINMIGDVIGTEHPQSYDLERAEGFIAEFDADGSGALEDAELQAAVESYLATSGEGTPAASPYSLEDLDTNGDGIVDQQEMAALTSFVNDEVLANAGADGTIDLKQNSSTSKSQTTSSATGSGASSDTTTESPLAGLTGEDFVSMYDIDGKTGLTTDEVTEIVTANSELIKTLMGADTDGKAGLSKAEIQSIASTEVGQGLLASGYTELTADDLDAFIENLELNNSILQAADLDGDGVVTAEEVDVLLAELNGNSTTTSQTTNSTGGSQATGTNQTTTTTNDSATEASQILATYDLDGDSQISTEELKEGISVNTAFLEAFKKAETDGKAGLSAAEVQASAELKSILPEVSELSAADLEQYTSVIETENSLLETLAASGKPVTAQDIQTALGGTSATTGTGTKTTTSTSTSTPTQTTTKSTSDTNAITSLLANLDWSDPTSIVKAFDTDGDGKLSIESEINASAKAFQSHAATLKSAAEALGKVDTSDTQAYAKAVSEVATTLQSAGLIDASVQPDAAYLSTLVKQFESAASVLGSLSALDTDADGFISAEEFSAALSGSNSAS